MNFTSPQELSIEDTFSDLLKCQYTLCYNIAQRLKPFDLTRQQYEVLNILYSKYPGTLNINAVKSKMHEAMPDISRIASRLKEKGYIKRLKKNGDKRNTEIGLSEEGSSLLRQVQPLINKEMENYFNNLSPEELLSLNKLINKIAENNRIR